jgi:dolichol-phosphate mannosyltransferase
MHNNPDVEMIVPVFNEREALPLVLAEWHSMFIANNIKCNFIICEDGSTDGTKQLLPELSRKYPVIINQKDYRRGYGRAILDGAECITADYVLCIDSDGQCDPADFMKLWEHRLPTRVIIGHRVTRQDTKLRQLYTKLFYLYFWLLFRGKVADPSSCFMLLPAKVLKENAKYIDFAAESFRWGVTAACLKQRVGICELPINHRARIAGRTRVFTVRTVPAIVWRGVKGMMKIRFTA